VALRNLIQARGLSKGRLAALYGLLERSGNVFAQGGRIGAFVGGDGRELAILDSELVDDVDSVAATQIQLLDETQGALEVGREKFGVIEKVIDGGLGVWVRRRLGGHFREQACIFSHDVALRGARGWRSAEWARQTLQPRVDGVCDEDPGNRQRGRDTWTAGDDGKRQRNAVVAHGAMFGNAIGR
jgi:hypothetical protein